MSEQGEHPRLNTVGVVGGSAVAGGIAGSVVANTLIPAKIEYVQGVEAEVSLSFHQGADVDSSVAHLDAPNVPVPTHFPGLDGIHAKITEFNPSGGTGRFEDQYASLISQFDSTVIQPTRDILIEHTLKGAGIGALAAGLASYGILHHVRSVRRQEAQTREDVQDLRAIDSARPRSRTGKIAERMEERLQARQRIRKIRNLVGAGTVTLGLIAGIGISERGSDLMDSESSGDMVPLSPFITTNQPQLEGATISGFSGRIINAVAYGATEYTNGVEGFWQRAAANFQTAYSDFENGAGRRYSQNGDLVAVAHVSDIHCNSAATNIFLKTFLARTAPDVVANTGDTYTNSNTMPYEANCQEDLENVTAEAADGSQKTIDIVNVAGNHDPKEPINDEHDWGEVVTLTEDEPETEQKGLHFVGAEDLSSTIWETLPADEGDLNRLEAKQGGVIADAACDVMADTGNPPIAMAHRTQMGYEVIKKGCASLVLSGHSHEERLLNIYRGDHGNIVYQHNIGSASGADVGLTIYETPKKPVSVSLQYFNNDTKLLVGMVTVELQVDGRVTIEDRPLPTNPLSWSEDNDLSSFLATYSETYQP